MPNKLIFVYNAKSGKLNTSLDMMHKFLSPKTYSCNLCELTHGVFNERVEWREFRKTTSISMEFLHTDAFQKAYASKFGHKFTFPIVLSENNGTLEVFVSTEELNRLNASIELIGLIEKRF